MANLFEPVIRTRFTDMAATIFTSQGTKCQDFEMRYAECMEAYGKAIGTKKCQDFKDDLNECLFAAKQTKRVVSMRLERQRQLYSGERPKEQEFGPVPQPDTY